MTIDPTLIDDVERLRLDAENRANGRKMAGTAAAWRRQADALAALKAKLEPAPPSRCPLLAFRNESCKRPPGHAGGCEPGHA